MVSPELVGNTQHATLRLLIEGTIDSPSNRSTPDPQRAPLVGNVSVTLQSNGKTSVRGTKDIYWDGSCLVTEPAEVECETAADLNHVAISRNYRRPNRRLAQRVDNQIRKRAYDEVKKKSGRASREAAALAERQVGGQLDSEVAKLLEQANAKIDEFYREPLEQLGLLPISSSHSGSQAIRLGFRGTHYGGIGAPHAAPDRWSYGDVELSLHESMNSNLWAGYLRGRLLTDRDFKNVHRELRGFVPQALRIGGNQPWSVRLDSEAPLEARFRNGRIHLVLGIESLTIEDQTWHCPFSLSTRYKVLAADDMPRFERDGDVKFQWLAAGPASDTEKQIVTDFAREKFTAFFAREMHLDGMAAPVGGAWGTAAELKIIKSEIGDGWWRVAFKARDMNRLK